MASNNDNHVIEPEDDVGDVCIVILFLIVRLFLYYYCFFLFITDQLPSITNFIG